MSSKIDDVKEIKDFIELLDSKKEEVINLFKSNNYNPIQYWITIHPYLKNNVSRKEKNIFKRMFKSSNSISMLVAIVPKKKDITVDNFKKNISISIKNKENGDRISFILDMDNISDLEIKNFYSEATNSISGAYGGDTELIPLIIATAKHNLSNALENAKRP